MTKPTDYYPASQRDIPSCARKYTFDYGGDSGVKVLRLPLNVKVCDVLNKTDKDLDVYVTFWNGTDYEDPDNAGADLHTANTSSRIDTIPAGERLPITQHEGYNTLIFNADDAVTGLIWLRPAQGQPNGYPEAGAVETRALVAVS